MTKILEIKVTYLLIKSCSCPVMEEILQRLLKLDMVVKIVQKSYKSKSLPGFLQVQSSIEWRFANKNRRQQQLRRQPLPSLLLSCSSLNTRQTNEYIKVRLTQNSYLFYANTKRATSVLICIFPVALFFTICTHCCL